MTAKQTFTRKEVRELLKRQIHASWHSYGLSPINMILAKSYLAKEYGDDVTTNAKRLKKVRVIKF